MSLRDTNITPGSDFSEVALVNPRELWCIEVEEEDDDDEGGSKGDKDARDDTINPGSGNTEESDVVEEDDWVYGGEEEEYRLGGRPVPHGSISGRTISTEKLGKRKVTASVYRVKAGTWYGKRASLIVCTVLIREGSGGSMDIKEIQAKVTLNSAMPNPSDIDHPVIVKHSPEQILRDRNESSFSRGSQREGNVGGSLSLNLPVVPISPEFTASLKRAKDEQISGTQNRYYEVNLHNYADWNRAPHKLHMHILENENETAGIDPIFRFGFIVIHTGSFTMTFETILLRDRKGTATKSTIARLWSETRPVLFGAADSPDMDPNDSVTSIPKDLEKLDSGMWEQIVPNAHGDKQAVFKP